MATRLLKKSLALALSVVFIGTAQANDPAAFNTEGFSDLVAAKFGNVEPNNVHKVLSAGKVSDTLLVSLAPNKMINFAHPFPQPTMTYIPSSARNLLALGGLGGHGNMISMEKIISLKPDLIIDVGSVGQSYVDTVKRVHEKTKVPVVLVDGNFADTPQQILTVSKYIGDTKKGERLANYAQRILDMTKDATQINGIAKSVYYARGVDGLETAPINSIHSEVLNWVGLKNVVNMKSQKSTARISMEQLYKWQPDIIVTQDPSAYQHIQTSPLWHQLKAVQEKDVYLVPNKPFGWLGQPPSVNRLLGALWLTHKLDPKRLDTHDYLNFVKNYFQLFYDYQLTPQDEKSLGIL